MRKYNNKRRVLIFPAKFYSATFRFTVIVARRYLKVYFHDFTKKIIENFYITNDKDKHCKSPF